MWRPENSIPRPSGTRLLLLSVLSSSSLDSSARVEQVCDETCDDVLEQVSAKVAEECLSLEVVDNSSDDGGRVVSQLDTRTRWAA